MTGSPVPSPPGPWRGGRVGDRAGCVLAPNPGPMTLDGTNTWVLVESGSREAVVVDPGPLDEDHLRRVLEAVAARGARVALTVLTHGHADHAESAGRFAELTGAPVRALAPVAMAPSTDVLRDGEVVSVGGLHLEVVATPGHTADSLSLLVPPDRAMLTGDTVLGRGTTVVAWPDGDLAAYLASLQRLALLADSGAVTRLWPGHGPVVDDAGSVLRTYLRHRRQRLEQVRAALTAGDRTAEEVVERVYADVPHTVWPAARQSVQAQLEYLREHD